MCELPLIRRCVHQKDSSYINTKNFMKKQSQKVPPDLVDYNFIANQQVKIFCPCNSLSLTRRFGNKGRLTAILL